MDPSLVQLFLASRKMRLPDARTPLPLDVMEAEIKGLEEDFEACSRR
jgi:hypothetical protein